MLHEIAPGEVGDRDHLVVDVLGWRIELAEVLRDDRAGLGLQHRRQTRLLDAPRSEPGAVEAMSGRMDGTDPVSYTHLTLPTIYSV